MTRNARLIFFASAVFFGLSTAAFAGTVSIQFLTAGPTNDGGVYTGIYGGKLNGTPADFMCDDYQDHITSGETWTASTATLEQIYAWDSNSANHDGFTGVTFGHGHGSYNDLYKADGKSPTAMQFKNYAEAAWIAENLLDGHDPSSQSNLDSFAIWTLLYDDTPVPGNLQGHGNGSLWWYLNSTSSSNTVAYWWTNTCSKDPSACANSFNNLTFYKPVKPTTVPGVHPLCNWDQPQEFIGLTQTPEPVSMVLMGSFLSLAGGVLRRKKRSA